MDNAREFEKNFVSSYKKYLTKNKLNITNDAGIDPTTKIINTLKKIFKSNNYQPQNIMDIIEFCSKAIPRDIIYLGQMIVKCLKSNDGNIFITWADAIENITRIAGTGPYFVIDGLELNLSKYKYQDCCKALETYIRFYFYFFKANESSHSLCKIYQVLEKHLNQNEIDDLLLVLPNKQAEYLLASKQILLEAKRNPIKIIKLVMEPTSEYIYYKLYNTKNNMEIGWGISSTECWAVLDAKRQLSDRIDISTDYELIID